MQYDASNIFLFVLLTALDVAFVAIVIWQHVNV